MGKSASLICGRLVLGFFVRLICKFKNGLF